MEKICWQITVAAFMQPLQYDLRDPAGKDNGITHAATARSNLDEAITRRSAETELQNTIELRANTVETPFTMRNRSETDPRMIREWAENDPTTHETVSHPSHRKGRSSTFGDALCLEKHRVSCICYLSKTHFVRDFLQNSIGNSSTSTICDLIYIAGTILQLQITMKFCRPHMDETQLKPHLQCGTDPRPIREWSDHTRDRLAPVAPHR